ncbi:hypothetical protein BGZ65_006742 [Modicella reniformis]|uniref:Uncharacterized protein n=1 Tax=Modicella reniformis TaxID=1440133 RepID=A0A9P6IJA7_9FUNG|nr:hypothetical protein BGZ65_006742 [Modicella reniformis]
MESIKSSYDFLISLLFSQERVVYNKEVQTVEGSFEPQGPSEEEIREQIKLELAQEEQLRQEILEAERQASTASVPEEIPELTDEERRALLQSTELAEFIEYSPKIVERAMSEKYDFMKDYTLGLDDDG